MQPCAAGTVIPFFLSVACDRGVKVLEPYLPVRSKKEDCRPDGELLACGVLLGLLGEGGEPRLDPSGGLEPSSGPSKAVTCTRQGHMPLSATWWLLSTPITISTSICVSHQDVVSMISCAFTTFPSQTFVSCSFVGRHWLTHMHP
jgi:hypothetical protein